MDIPKRLESLHGLILSYISWGILCVCMQQSKRTPKVRKTTFGVYFSSITKTIAVFLLEPAKDRAKIACIDCSKERAVNTYRGSSNLTSSVLVKLWSKFSAKSENVQNDEKTTVFKGFKPQKRSIFGRSDRTRTCSILVPNQARYQLRYTSMVKKLMKL